jgi:hypothetical protein
VERSKVIALGSILTFALFKVDIKPAIPPARWDVSFCENVLLHSPQLNLPWVHPAGPVLFLHKQSDKGGPNGHVLHWASKGSGFQADAFGVFVIENTEGVNGVGKVYGLSATIY